MGLLDSLLSMAAGAPKATKTNTTAVESIFDLIKNQQNGGLEGLVGKLTKAGLGNAVDSWISTGKNKSISSSQLNNALGSDIIGQLAGKLGVSNTAAASLLAKFLPMIIDKLTPEGKVSTAKPVDVTDILAKILKK